MSQDGLIRNFYRPLGFKKADKISSAAREQGSKLAEVFEKYRKTGKTGKISVYNKTCVQNWTRWFEDQSYQILADEWVEPHLVNTKEGYHGSPDVITHNQIDDTNTYPVLGDDKSKKRHADYRLLMNEHAYAMCDSYSDPVTKEIKLLPWVPPIHEFWFWTFSPNTGELYPVKHEFKEEIYYDFLICKMMRDVNKRAEAYFRKFAVLLPDMATEK